MKKVAFGMACGLVSLFVFVMMLTLYGRAARQDETKAMLSQAIDSSLANAMQGRDDTIQEKEAFVADFLKALLIQANSDSDITVSVLEADYEQGILSVEITEKFRHPNGNTGSVSEVRTVIFDKAKEEKPEYKSVCFYTGDEEVYKEYRVPKDAVCNVPASPRKEGKTFECWRFVTGGTGKAGSKRMACPGGTKNILTSGGVPYAAAEDTKLIAVFR